MSESVSSKGSRRSQPESNSSQASPTGASRPPRSGNKTNNRGSQQPSDNHTSQVNSNQNGRANNRGGEQQEQQSSDNQSHTNNGTSNRPSRRTPLPTWCYVPPKEGQSKLRKDVLLFGKKKDVYWCHHHERWDIHRLRECPIEQQLESYKHQLEMFFISRQEVLELQEKLHESESKVKNQRDRLKALDQKLRNAGIHKSPSHNNSTTADSKTSSLDDFMNRQESNALKSQLQILQDELDKTRQELVESEAKLKRLRSSNRKSSSSNSNSPSAGEEQMNQEIAELQRRLEQCEKKSEGRRTRIHMVEANYKEVKERLKEEQELRKKNKKELDEQVAVNKRLQDTQASISSGSPRNSEADKSIYRLSESLATVTGALESERAARMALEKDFAQERKEYEEKLQEARTQLERSQMLLVAKRQTSATNSNASFRSNGNYVKICRTLLYSHHNVDDDKVQLIQETASELKIGGFIKGGKPGLIVVEGLEEDCDAFLNALAKQHRNQRKSPPGRNGQKDSATFAAAGKVISQADTIEEGRAFPKDLTQLDNEGGLDELKALCASTGLLDLIDEVCKR